MMTVTQLNAMSVKDLLAMNRMLVDVIKDKQRMANRSATIDFRPGDQVSYTGKYGPTSGKIIEVKRTKVVVSTPRGNYLVPASMLSKG